MVPSNALVTAANKSLANQDFRESVRQMHAEGYPLVDMVEALGLEDDMSARIRAILVDLPADVIAQIRQATLDMLDSGNFVMPLQCAVTDSELQAGVPVAVDVTADGTKTIRVRTQAAN